MATTTAQPDPAEAADQPEARTVPQMSAEAEEALAQALARVAEARALLREVEATRRRGAATGFRPALAHPADGTPST